MRKIGNDKELTEVFTRVGRIYGYRTVRAKFESFADFKVKWERSYSMADFSVSDYIMNCDEDIIEKLAEVLFRRICNLMVEGYGERFNSYILSEEFREKNVPLYVDRHNLEKGSFTKYRDEVSVYWSNKPLYNFGYCSTLMKVIVMNPELKDAPKEVLDTLIALEYNFIQDGLMNFGAEVDRIVISPKDENLAKEWLVDHDIRIGSGMFE